MDELLSQQVDEGHKPKTLNNKIFLIKSLFKFAVEDIRRRTHVIRIFPNHTSCLRMALALYQEQDEGWLTGKRYLDISLLA